MASATVSTEHGEYSYSTMPTNRAVAMTYRFKVFQAFQGKGHGHVLKRHQLERLAAEHYDYATATVDASNAAQKRVLTKAGFRWLDTFANTKTGSNTELWGRAISTIKD